MDQFIWTKQNALPQTFCNHLISKFDADERKSQGQVGRNEVWLDMKRSVDLGISQLGEWKEEDKILYETLHSSLPEYFDSLNLSDHPYKGINIHDITSDTGYQIQKTMPGEYYKWHHDFMVKPFGSRILTFIFYLNDVIEDGYTEFFDGTRIQPETGKLLIFPATWSYIHQGYPPKSEVKYICTGWMHSTRYNID